MPLIMLAPIYHAVSANSSTQTLRYAPNNAHLSKATLEQTAG